MDQNTTTVAIADWRIDRDLLAPGVGDSVTVEASTAGLAPGQWPLTIATTDRFGRAVIFERASLVRNEDGELTHARYVAGIRRSNAWVQRMTLLVWND